MSSRGLLRGWTEYPRLSQVFQNAYGLAVAPYCLLPAGDAVVNIKN